MSDTHKTAKREFEEPMVIRTFYLPAQMDVELRDVAQRNHVSKNDLIMASLANRLLAWTAAENSEKIEDDMQLVLEFS